MLFLIEPYNAYQKPPKKRHPTEIAEEEALFYYIMEQQRLEQQKLLTEKSAIDPNQAQNLAIISQHVPPPSQQVQDGTPGLASANGGAGGTRFFFEVAEDTEQASFAISPTAGSAPITITFTNNSQTPGNDQFLWILGDGTTSTAPTPPVKVYDTGSFTITLQETSSTGNMTSATTTLSASLPVLTANFTYTTSSNIGPVTASFTNTTTNTSQTPSTTYLWLFGDGTTSTLASPTHAYANTGSFTASLQATGSYNETSVKTTNLFNALAPTVAASFTFTTSSNAAPSTFTWTNTSTYNGSGALTYLWIFGSGSLTSNLQSPPPTTYTAAGTYTIRLQVTESSYNRTSATSSAKTIS